jgi:hypothetical protein
MPGRDRLREIVHEASEEAKAAVSGLTDCAVNADHMSEHNVDQYADRAHNAVARAAEAAKILCREEGG